MHFFIWFHDFVNVSFIWRESAYLKNSKTPNLETWFSLDSDSQYIKVGTLILISHRKQSASIHPNADFVRLYMKSPESLFAPVIITRATRGHRLTVN